MSLKNLLSILFLYVSSLSFGQYTASDVRHFIKLEGGSILFYKSTLSDASTSFKPEATSVVNINAIWGWDFNEKRFLGIGGGYTGYQDYSGASIFGEINFFVSNTHVNPYIGMRVGYEMLFPTGLSRSGDALAEFLTGLQIRFGDYTYVSIYLQSGLAYRQKTLYVPLRLGIRF